MCALRRLPLCLLLLLLSYLASAAVSVEGEGGEAKDRAFEAWFAEQAGRPQGGGGGGAGGGGGGGLGVGVQVFDGMGRGVVARESVWRGKEVLFVPKKMIITGEVARRELGIDPSQQAGAERAGGGEVRSDAAAMALFLVREMQDEESRFAPYLRVLPEHVTQLSYFSTTELQELQDKSLSRRGLEQGADLRRQWEDTAAARERLGLSDDFATFQWAMSMIDSRALTFQGQRSLIPFSDMFNYAPTPNAGDRGFDNGADFLRFHQMREDGLHIFADRDCARGEQLFEDYGDNDDAIYLLYHGFVPEENPLRSILVDTPSLHHMAAEAAAASSTAPLPDDKRFELKRNLLVAQGLQRPPTVRLRKNFGTDRETRIYLTVVAMSDEETTACAATAGKDKILAEDAEAMILNYAGVLDWIAAKPDQAAPPMPCCLGAAMRLWDALNGAQDDHAASTPVRVETPGACIPSLQRLATALRQSLDERIAEFVTTEEEDRQAAAAPTASENLKLAIRYRLSQKQLVRDLVARLNVHFVEAESDTVAALADSSTATTTNAGSSPADASLEERLEALNVWIRDIVQPPTHRIEAAVDPVYRAGAVVRRGSDAGDASDGGVLATGDVYLAMPTQWVMDAQTAMQDARFGPFLEQLNTAMQGRRDSFHELLFFLLYHRFVEGDNSKWAPYINTLPRTEEMINPVMFTEESSIDLMGMLKAAPVYAELVMYQRSVRGAFDFISKHDVLWPALTDFFGDAFKLTWEAYLWAHTILDSRAIWWKGERHLVPLLDLINCRENDTFPDRVHATALDEATGKFAETRAAWDFVEGEQIFENYGQPNHIYFMYHGFTLQPNTHDCAQILVNTQQIDALPADTRGALLKRYNMPAQRSVCLRPPKPLEPMDPRDVLFLRIAYGLLPDDVISSGGSVPLAGLDMKGAPEVARLLPNLAAQQLRAYEQAGVPLQADASATPHSDDPRVQAITQFLASEVAILQSIVGEGAM